MPYSSYYQASVSKKDTWYLVAILRSFEHLAFDRTLDAQKAIFEFYVPHDNENIFVQIMEHFKKENIVFEYQKLPNRLQDPAAVV